MRLNSIDDVQDNSVLRRGIPVAHNIFGTAQTINSANYVYFLALQEVRKLNSPAAMEIYTEELLNLHKGQGMDLFWRDTLTCPTEEEYLEMVNNKTGGLFRLAVKLMQAESETGKYVISRSNSSNVNTIY
jgi:geranylgeranyl diphosphate synthase, type III